MGPESRRYHPLVVLFLLAFAAVNTHAQVRTTGSIVGTIRDASGAIVPEAQVEAADVETNIGSTLKAGKDGGFVFAALQPGTYRLLVTADRFQPAVVDQIVVTTGRGTNVSVQLEIGAVTEEIRVSAGAPVIETTSSTISSTVRNAEIAKLPLLGRNVLDFALLVPGAAQSSTGRYSQFNGLPSGAINITLDGVNNNSQRFRSGGTSFFTFAPVRLGSVEEVTVSTAGLGADAGAEGAAQIQFVTRRGTNAWRGQVFEQLRNDILNANSVFNVARNIPKSKLRQNEFGGNLGGPNIKNKLFFFGNYEMIRQPNQDTRTATILNAEAQQGIFRYLDNDNVQRTANLLDIARAAGYPGTIDPFIAQQLATINGTLGGGSVAANDCVPQPGTESRLDAQGDKIMQRLVYRRLGNQESIVAVHSVNSAAGAGGVRWYEFRVDTSSKTKERRLTLHQQGTYAPDNAYRWMASPAIDRRGNIAIGYSFGGTPHYAGQRFAARLASDPKGVMSLRETVLVDGEGVQNAMRWEDYTQTAIDPTDDCTIWYVGDYMKKDITSYSTRIGAFRLPGCGRAR